MAEQVQHRDKFNPVVAAGLDQLLYLLNRPGSPGGQLGVALEIEGPVDIEYQLVEPGRTKVVIHEGDQGIGIVHCRQDNVEGTHGE